MPMVSDSIRALAAALVCVALLIAALVLGRDVLMPLVLASILAFILSPLVRMLVELRVPHGAAVGLALGSAVTVIVAGLALFSAQLLSLTADLSLYKDNLAAKVRTVTGSDTNDGILSRAMTSIEIVGSALKQKTSTGRSPASANANEEPEKVVVAKDDSVYLDQAKAFLHQLALVGITLLFALFLLLQHHEIRDRVVRLAGTDNMTETTSALSDAGERLSHLFLRQLIINVGFGLIVGVALMQIGVPNPALWGVATCFLRFIPYVGSIIAAIPPVLLAAAVDPGWGKFSATLALFLIGEPIVGHLVEPTVLGRGIGLSPFAMVTAASFWALIWGPVGLLLAAPLTMTLVVLGQYIPRLEFLSVLLSDAPALAPPQQFYHRLLSEDAAAAVTEIEEASEGKSIIAACDAVALPALRLAARDQRNALLDKEQITSMQETMDEVTEIIASDAAADNATTVGRPENPDVVVLAARGPIDIVGARFVAALLNHAAPPRNAAAIEQGTGMMAIAAARATKDLRPATIIISTVGGMDRQHLRLLERRAKRDFDGAQVFVCDWHNASGGEPPGDGKMQVVSRLGDLMEQLRLDRPSRDTTEKVLQRPPFAAPIVTGAA